MPMPAPASTARRKAMVSSVRSTPCTATSTSAPAWSKRSTSPSPTVRVAKRWAGRSASVAGCPCCARYCGDAHSTERHSASGRAITVGSSVLLMRTARSMRSSTRSSARSPTSRVSSTRGCRRWNSAMAVASCASANEGEAVTRNAPVGSRVRAPASASTSSARPNIWRLVARAASPASVRLTRRVVRCSRRAPSQSSAAAR